MNTRQFIVAYIIILSVIVLGMWGCPAWNVYRQRKEGEAQLAHARSSKEVAVMEAKAKYEAADFLSRADTLRAHGIARSNQIIGQSLKQNQEYLQWLWIDQLDKNPSKEIIYVPSSSLGLPIMEATRLQKPPVIINQKENE